MSNVLNENQIRAKSLSKRLLEHPEMLERFESIMKLAEPDSIGSFDEVEGRLVEEVRRLGGQTLESWLERKESEIAA